MQKTQARQVYIDTYMETLNYLIKHTSTQKKVKGEAKDFHNQAKQIAQYKTFLATGVNITDMDLPSKMRGTIYRKISGSKKSKVISSEIKRVMQQAIPTYGNSASSLTKDSLARNVRAFMNKKQPVQKDGLLKAVGLDHDARLTTVVPGLIEPTMEKRFVKPGETPAPDPIRQAELERINKQNLLRNASAERLDGEFILNPAFENRVKLEDGEKVVPRDYSTVSFDGSDAHREYRMLELIEERYSRDPYDRNNGWLIKDPSGAVDEAGKTKRTVIQDAYGRTLYRRTPTADTIGLPFHDHELEMFEKVMKSYRKSPGFYGAFGPTVKAEKQFVEASKTATALELHAMNNRVAEQFRADLLNARDLASAYVNRVNADRQTLIEIRSVVGAAKKSRTSIYEMLKAPKYAHTDYAQHVLSNVDGDFSDDSVRRELGYFLRRSDKMFIPLDMLETDFKSHRKFMANLGSKINATRDPKNDTYYKQAIEYRDFLKDYNDMYRQIGERMRIVSGQDIRDAGFTQDDRDGRKNGLLTDEERENLYRETTKGIKEQEFADQVMSRADMEAETSNRQRIRNMVLEEMESPNSKSGNAMKHYLLNTIERNIGTLTTVAKGDSEADKLAADEEFAKKLMAHLKVNQRGTPLQNLTLEGMNAIIEGFGIDRTDLKSARARVMEKERELKRPLTTVLEQKQLSTNERLAMWRDAVYRQELAKQDKRYLRVPGRQGRFQIVSTNDVSQGITLQAEHLLAENVTVHLPVDPERVHKIAQDLDTYRYNQEVGRQWRYEQAQDTIRNSYVELRYQHQVVNDKMREEWEDMYNKIIRLDKHLYAGMTPEQIVGAKSVNIPVANLLEPYNQYMSRVSDGTTENLTARLPNMIKNMVETSMPYMQQLGRGDELASMAYMSLLDAVHSLPEERTIDLSDHGLEERWKAERRHNYKPEELEEFRSGLSEMGMKERLDDFLSRRIQNRMYNQFYNKFGTEGEQRRAGESVVHDVLRMLKTEHSKTGSADYQPTAGNVRSFIHKVGNELKMMPFYSEAMKFSEPEIAEMIRDGEIGNKNVSYEDYFKKFLDDYRSEYDKAVAGLEGMEDEVAKASMRKALDQGMALAEATQGLDTLEISKVIEANKEEAAKAFLNRQMKSHNDLLFTYDVMTTDDPHNKFLNATINHEGRDYAATIRQGTGGEMIAHIPQLNLHIPILRSSQEARFTVQPHQIEPEQSFAGRTVKEVTKGGGVRRSHIGDYATIQGNVQSNPNDTFDLMKKMMSNEINGVYLDMETTGLSHSTLDPKLVQPLEIYMQEAMWNQKANDFYRIGGEVGVRANGRTKAVTQHMFIKPSEDVISYANKLMNDWTTNVPASKASLYPLTFGVGNESITIMDVLRAKGDKEGGAWRNLEKRVLSHEGGERQMARIQQASDQIWFLRNLAKYSGNEATFTDHIGYNDANLQRGDMPAFLNQLFADTRKALENFEEVRPGKLKLFDIMPELRNAKVVSPEQAVKMYSDFTNGKAIMGQNVAEADVQKFFGIAKNYLDTSMADVFAQKDDAINALVRDLENTRDPIMDNYATMIHPDDPTQKFALLTQNQVNDIFDGKSDIKPEQIQVLNDVMDDEHTITKAFAQVAADHHGGDLREMKQYVDGDIGFDSVYVMPHGETTAATRAERETLINTLRNAGPDEFVDLVRQHNLPVDLSKLDDALSINANLHLPQVIEQMFAASYGLPGLGRRNAETIQEALGRDVSSTQHMAKGDVKIGLEVQGDLFRRAAENPEFQAYTGDLLTGGDYVFHHSQVAPNVPIGVYQVDNVNGNSIEMTAIHFEGDTPVRGQSHTIYGLNEMDLDRRFQLNFDHTTDPKAAYDEYAIDQARRQISRATQSAFQFDKSEMEYKLRKTDAKTRNDEVDIRGPLAQLEEVRENLGPMHGPAFGEPSLLERVAMDSTSLFNRPDFREMAKWNITPAKQAAFGAGGEFYASPEGQARRAFLGEVAAMQEFGIIDDKVGRSLIRSMNESIIAKGREKGYTRVPVGQAHAGVMDGTFGAMEGNPLALDISSNRRLHQSLFSHAQRLVGEAEQRMDSGGMYVLEHEKKAAALNNILFPFLKKQGILEYDKEITVPQAIQQIMSRQVVDPGATPAKGQLQRFEEYDFLSYQRNGQDADFIGHIMQKHDELLGEYRNSMSPIQQDLVQRQMAEVNQLRAEGNYHPAMTVRPQIDTEKFPVDSISINDFAGLKQVPNNVLEARFKELEGSGVVQDTDLRTNIMNELFERATGGRANSIEGLPGENMNEVGRMEAARILGFMKKTDTGYEPATDIGEMYFGTKYYSGPNEPLERFSATKIKDLPMTIIENILARDYNESDGDSYIKGLLTQYTTNPKTGEQFDWKSDHRGDRNIPRREVVNPANVTEEMMVQAGGTPSHLRAMTEARNAGNPERARQLSIYQERSLDIDMNQRVREPGAIGQAIKDAREGISNFVGEGGAGHGMAKAGMWMAGIGIAAYALKQFASAGGPLKFEHRPQGHGVEGIGGAGDNDDQQRKPLVNDGPSTGQTAIVAPQGSSKGYAIRARAKNNGTIDHSDVTNEMQSQIGSFNVNLRDDREKMDRGWLEGQMDQYISRGHLG